MKRWTMVLLLAALLGAGCSGSDREIEQVVRDFHAAFDAKNMTALTALCTEDMYWYTLNGKQLGRGQIGEFFGPMFARFQGIKTELGGLEIRRSGGMAVARYSSSLKIDNKGRINEMKNLYTTVLVKQGGQWQIWHHQMSTE